MTENVLADCVPASDHPFRARVSELLRGNGTWDLASPEGVALMQTLLRGSYPMATVAPRRIADGGVALEIRRDGTTGPEALSAAWLSAAFDRHAPTVYGLAVRITGDRGLADAAMLECFRWIAATVPPTVAIESVTAAIRAKVCETAIAVLRAPRDSVAVPRSAVLHSDPREWWHDPTLPRTVLSNDHVYVDANEAAGRLFGVAQSSILGRRVGSFMRREPNSRVGEGVFARLRDGGEVTSTAVVVRPDGSDQAIEFHAAVASVGTVTVMRERQQA